MSHFHPLSRPLRGLIVFVFLTTTTPLRAWLQHYTANERSNYDEDESKGNFF